MNYAPKSKHSQCFVLFIFFVNWLKRRPIKVRSSFSQRSNCFSFFFHRKKVSSILSCQSVKYALLSIVVRISFERYRDVLVSSYRLFAQWPGTVYRA